MQGVADLVVFGAEEIWLLDYKTDHFAEPELAAKLGEYGLDRWLRPGEKWDLIHFNFGIHDRGTPVKDYAARLETIAERLQRTGAKVLWASTTPIPDDPAQKQTAASIVERNVVAAELMARRGIPVDDLFAAITPRLAELQNPRDVHFRPEGYDFLGARVAAAIRAATALQAWMTVPWSRPPKASPMSMREFRVSSRARYIASWRGSAMDFGRRRLVMSASRMSKCSATTFWM